MEKHMTFGNADLAKKMVTRFGMSQQSVQVEMRFAKEVRQFIQKVDKAHKKAASSKLIFG
ncbi:MAG: hypothetical protein K9K37_04220 [Desulfocapsa sp.]|nr:hypothetical protein [Desulfocapsa sp.]